MTDCHRCWSDPQFKAIAKLTGFPGRGAGKYRLWAFGWSRPVRQRGAPAGGVPSIGVATYVSGVAQGLLFENF